ncbi:LOW QUALITY PROTEIN: kazrin-like [Alosa alosa]|uniref:LOW QUALITY PROTEIN: kazrin-like n=1 Tax=Alosa alosa TaxID=278164 RepID=UPI00201506E6|nr:LOW QUALITY PROTEIN: kazrin-like [Alosa alosa]
MEDTLTCSTTTFSQVFGRQGQLMQATVQSLNSLNDQIAHFMVTRPSTLTHEDQAFLPSEKDTLKQSMALMRHLLMDAQGKILKMMEDNKQLALRIDGAIQSASQEVTNLRSELTATSRRLAELTSPDANQHHNHMLLREEVVQLQEEVSLLKQMKEMLSKDLEETHGGSSDLLSVTELRVQLGEKEQELDRAKEALQEKRINSDLKVEKADLVNQMQQVYSTLESREEQLREFIRNYDQHRKEDAVKTLAGESDQLERRSDLGARPKRPMEHTGILRLTTDLKENRIKELEAELPW